MILEEYKISLRFRTRPLVKLFATHMDVLSWFSHAETSYLSIEYLDITHSTTPPVYITECNAQKSGGRNGVENQKKISK